MYKSRYSALQRSIKASMDLTDKIVILAKEDLVEDLRALYGDMAADQVAGTGAAMFIEMAVVDPYGHVYLLDPIAGSH